MKANILALLFVIAATSLSVAAEGKHLFILSGQSNMREPLIGTFAETVKKALGVDKVLIASHGHPGQPIRSWYRKWTPPEGVEKPAGGADVYDGLMKSVGRVMQGQELASVTLVWMQGEEDARMGYASRYEESFFGVLEQIKSDLGTRDINFVIGRINDYWLPDRGIVDGEAMRALQVRMAESHDRGAWIDTDDLNTGVNPWGGYEIDGGHFPNPGYRVMGKRFARMACGLVAPDLKPDEALFAGVFPDDARKFASNLATVATVKTVTGTEPDADPSGGKPGLAALVDGKLGAPDHSDPAWLAFPPEGKEISFVIDLGAPVDISAVAVNLLTDHRGSAHFPGKIDVSVSADAVAYRHLLDGRSNAVSFDKHARQKNLSKDFKPQSTLVFIEKQALAVRYVKVDIVPDTAVRLLLDEIMVNPVMK